MASPNMLLRDPLIYRIKFAHHHRTGDTWCIYPMYDFAHGQSDSIEEITHSICTLEFENHRPLYNWFIEALGIFPSRQIEFARLNITYTIMSKRKLLQLVNQKHVSGWDDPRMPTISGLRRRGYTPESLREFARRVGVAKRDNVIDVALLEFCVREDLNNIARRVMAVLDPVLVTISNYPDDQTEMLDIDNNPEDVNAGSRQIPFSRQLYIERDDFMVDPPKKYFRMTPGQHVRLKSAFILHCDRYQTDPVTGAVTEIFCSYFPESRSGSDTSGIKAKGTLHWVSASHAVNAEVRLYDRLFVDENPLGHEDKEFLEFINPDSLRVVQNAKVEPGLRESKPGDQFQFLRLGYFCADRESTSEGLVFNRTVTLKDSWSREKSS
jgi:glutaminyl-tRNA synthetase